VPVDSEMHDIGSLLPSYGSPAKAAATLTPQNALLYNEWPSEL